MFLFRALIKYPETSLLIDEEFHIDKDAPITVMIYFNVDVRRNEKAFGFTKKNFFLNMVLTNYPSTLGVLQYSPELLNYVGYFSYHRLILHRIATCPRTIEERKGTRTDRPTQKGVRPSVGQWGIIILKQRKERLSLSRKGTAPQSPGTGRAGRI
ncbi:hypothetical protein AVEN_155275-1 [Araneus ventricosus]|uniref:Uncharacterized protein n=1 Tax=Araneus ventricosus TaxID=182803 RepID=A0A4Y2D670_ARAVE|nr:hypothetical protein AVEN_155275-1 [Araneus ventricosus]